MPMPKINFMKTHPVEAEMDERMDTHDKASSHILQLCEHT